MNATERVLDLLCRLTSRAEADVLDALDIGAILGLGNIEVLDIVDDLEALGIVRRVIGADAESVIVKLTAFGVEECERRRNRLE